MAVSSAPGRTRATGHSSRASVAGIQGPTEGLDGHAVGEVSRRRARKMSRPWKDVDTSGSWYSRASSRWAAVMPPSRSAAGMSRAIVGTDQDVATCRGQGQRVTLGPDTRVDHGDVGADRQVGQRRPERHGAVADLELGDLGGHGHDRRGRSDGMDDPDADGRRGIPGAEVGGQADERPSAAGRRVGGQRSGRGLGLQERPGHGADGNGRPASTRPGYASGR